MSSPQTNLEKQKRRHIGPIVGISAALAFAAVMFFAWTFWSAQEATPPEGADVQIDGRTGEPSQTDAPEAPAPAETLETAPEAPVQPAD